MKTLVNVFAAAICALATFACSASATVVYDNGTPDENTGFEITGSIRAEDFMLRSTTTLSSVKFWDVEKAGAYNGSFTWQIYAAGASGPGALLFGGNASDATHVATGNILFGSYKEYVDTISFSSLTLTAGNYWIGLHNGPLTNKSVIGLFWDTAAANNTASNEASSLYDSKGYVAGNGYQLAFQLNGSPATVPDKGNTLLLLGLGVSGLLAAHRLAEQKGKSKRAEGRSQSRVKNRISYPGTSSHLLSGPVF